MHNRSVSVAGRRRRKLGALLVVGALVAASCGSDDDGGGAADTAAPATEAEDTATTAAEEATTTATEDTTRHDRARGRGQGHRLRRVRGWLGAADTSLEPVKVGYFNQQGGQVEVSNTNVTGVEIAVKYINEEAGWHRRPAARDRDVLRRQRRRGRPAVRAAVRQRRLDRRRPLRADVHRYRVVLLRAGRLQAGGARRVGERGGHRPGHRGRPLRRRSTSWRCTRRSPATRWA